MLTADQIQPMFPDLTDPDLESALALVHQRFSTNTFPSWPLAHPYRYVAHNGEINTLTGNINWMRAREGLLQSDVLGDDLKKVLPVIREGGSDTATFDNVLEFLVMTGRSLPHALLMMIPEPWAGHESMSPALKAFYEYHSSLMEPWDGPASIAFTDGTVIGAVLDRNGLRPSRYYVTERRPRHHGVGGRRARRPAREHPHQGAACTPGGSSWSTPRAAASSRTRRSRASWRRRSRTREWIEHLVDIEDLPAAPHLPPPSHETVRRRQQLFGYTDEDLRILLAAMATTGEEALGSMGTDTALAALSDRPRLLYDYFKQLFAQVTNPPLDAIREELVTSMASTIGPEGNLLDPRPESCRQIKITHPVIDNDQTAKLRYVYEPGFRSITLPMLFDPRLDGPGMEQALDELDAPGQRRGRRRLHDPDPVRPRRRSRPRADPQPARHGRRAPPSGAARQADAVRAGHRVGRRARGAPLRAAARLRRRRRQSVPRLRDARRHDPPAPAGRRHARAGRRQLHPRAEQGHSQGDVQDGHLHAVELLRRADLRGDRPRPAVRRSLFHAHVVAHRRRRRRGGRRRGGPPAPHGVLGPGDRDRRPRLRRRVSVAA